MKPVNLAIYMAFAVGLSAPMQAMASGIPTFDAASIAQMVADALQQAEQADRQLSATRDDTEQSRQQFEQTVRLITGNSGYGSYYNSSDLYNYAPTNSTSDSWQQIYTLMTGSTLNTYRDRYGLTSSNTTQQAVYDAQLASLRTLENAQRANNLRLENLRNLQALADQAETPQEKQDIQARLAVEQAAIANEANRLATVQSLMDRQDKFLIQKQNREFSTFLSGQE